jgi:membrane protease YdiL (CAAX protease family)
LAVSDGLHELQWSAIAYGSVAGLCILTLITLWLYVPAIRGRWLPLPRLRPGSWSGYDVFLVFCIYRGFPLLIVYSLLQLRVFAAMFGPEPDLERPSRDLPTYLSRCFNVSWPLILTVSLGMIVLVIFARSGSRPHHYGITWARWPANLTLGLVAFIVITPVVLGVYAPVALIFPETPHPMVTTGRADLHEWEWAFLAFQAIVAAPILEEIVFRGILQGWLRRATLRGHLAIGLVTMASVLEFAPATVYLPWLEYFSPLMFAAVLIGGYGWLLRRQARQFGLSEIEILHWQLHPVEPTPEGTENLTEDEARERRQKMRTEDEQRQQQWDKANADIAILGSAMLFALGHASAWPAPLPLVLFGLVLGWLARRTQSLIAPITLHALFNLVAFITLYGTVLSAPATNGNADTTAVRESTVNSVPASQLPLRK